MPVAVDYKTCKVTIVTPGLSDSRINIYPAEHEEEKIWLNGVQGIERWDMIQRNMSAYAEKGTRVPKPVPYHNDPRNLMTITLKEQDVPLVRLDGWVLPEPPPEPKAPDLGNAPNSMLEVGRRIGDLERIVSNLAQAVSTFTNQKTETAPNSKEPPKPAKQSDDLASSAVPVFICNQCESTFNFKSGLANHKRFKHKEV